MWDWIGKLDELRRAGELAVLVTVVKSSGSTPRKHGAKMIVLPDGTFFGTVGGGVPELYALEDARRCFQALEAGTSTVSLQQRGEFPACGGTMEFYLEVINDNPRLYLFGAGHVAQSLCQVLEGTPFRIHLVDERNEWVNAPELPNSVIRHQSHFSDFIAGAAWCGQRTFVTIVTFNGAVDQQVLQEVLPHPARYIGMIGSRNKWERISSNLTAQGCDLSRVRCPIGHDTGGDSPREIAISIASQLLATYHGKE
ncbi:XdhC family protein [Geomesophilobacter sediminis]|uniref:XdhC family protein n=1 Tax=Geomesophilobacter sediminis TaxID=2798584 RepID=A0A8J7M252_9BACT|nr:XdhC/CoxI family protein [Geomesophilobacter sediminis]MBJ6727119.1 XdhC family protein [Geomesophilobacter sediminis]